MYVCSSHRCRRGQVSLVNVGGGAYEVERDRFLCELVDSDMSVRSPWERTKRRLVSNAHIIKHGESCVPGRVSEGVTHPLK